MHEISKTTRGERGKKAGRAADGGVTARETPPAWQNPHGSECSTKSPEAQKTFGPDNPGPQLPQLLGKGEGGVWADPTGRGGLGRPQRKDKV